MQTPEPITVTTDFVAIICEVAVDAPAETAWERIGAFGDAGRFLDVASELVVGSGEVGSLRRVGDAVLEVLVGRSEASYTYAQTEGPMAVYRYHGCVSLTASSADRCSLTYVISYDQSAMAQSERDAQHRRISDRFQGAAETMKRVAERKDRT